MNAKNFTPEALRLLRAERDCPTGTGALQLLATQPTDFKNQVDQVVECAVQVLNALGPGLDEKPYENALVVELGLRGIPFIQQARFPITYKRVQVGEFTPALVVCNSLVIETKVIAAITENERDRVSNWLRITGLKAGIILNFNRSLLEWERLIAGLSR